MSKNKIQDLNDHLFAQLERLNDENIPDEKMEMEFKKAAAISKVASQLIQSNKMVLDAVKVIGEGIASVLPEQFGVKKIEQ